jgi:hypothetical protein
MIALLFLSLDGRVQVEFDVQYGFPLLSVEIKFYLLKNQKGNFVYQPPKRTHSKVELLYCTSPRIACFQLVVQIAVRIQSPLVYIELKEASFYQERAF